MKLFKSFTLLCLLLLTACGSIYWSSANAMKIQKGMTPQEVIAAIGKPDQRRFNSNVEEWEYTSSDHSTVVIDFTNGRVSSMDTFKKPQFINPVPGPGVIASEPQDDAFFQRLYNNVKRATFSDDKQKALHQYLGDADISCSECARLLKLFSFDDDKVKALKYMAPHLANNEFEVILDCFTFQSGKDKAYDILKRIKYQQRRN